MTNQVEITSFANNVGKKFSPEIGEVAKAALKELAQNLNLGKELQAEYRLYMMRQNMMCK